jgi:hypothetical protein
VTSEASRCHNGLLVLPFAVLLPEIQVEDTEDRLREVVAMVERMMTTLGFTVGTLFHDDPQLKPDLEIVLQLLGRFAE